MIVILYQKGCQAIAEKTEADLVNTFADSFSLLRLPAEAGAAWPSDIAWDDLLIVIFDGNQFPAEGNGFIEDYIAKRPETALLLPVSIDASTRKPPEAAAAIKALQYDATSTLSGNRLVARAGAMLGLRLQGRDSKIFISYRANDGTAIANQLHGHLKSLGHQAFLDEARELDGDTRVLPGTAVQAQIDEALRNANLLLLLDTPAAPGSPWIKHEVDTADALLLPILPVCFRDAGDPRQGPRFRSLIALQRWISLERPPDMNDPPLNPSQLDQITNEIETYLCEIFRRKCRVPFMVENQFVAHGFAWKTLDKRLLIFESLKQHSPRLLTRVMSHCSLFDQIYSPAIRRFDEYLTASGRGNYSLFIYDGELLSGPQMEDIVAEHTGDVIILHHQELAALIDSGFTKLGAAA